MKTTDSMLQKCHASLRHLAHTVWMRLRRCVHSRPHGGTVQPDAVPREQGATPLNTLDRITEHLRHLELGQKVKVRPEIDGGFVLEDADGFVHAKDYDQAVAVIERIWLYQP